MDDLDKYILEQAKTEVEHTRSWPNKILAFYVAINVAVVTAVFSMSARQALPKYSDSLKWPLAGALLVLAYWSLSLLRRNHLSYLSYRNIQVEYQPANKSTIENRGYSIPVTWFSKNPVSWRTRFWGWGFYAFLVVMVAIFSLVAVLFC